MNETGRSGGDESRPPCILIVEDEVLLRMLLVDMLDELGFSAVEAGTAQDAMVCLRSDQRFEAAIIDLGLPDKMGDVLASEVRTFDARLPIVIGSGYGEDAVRAKFDGDPLIRFMGKPYLGNQVDTVLRSLGVQVPRGA